jgi:hypothetical protein
MKTKVALEKYLEIRRQKKKKKNDCEIIKRRVHVRQIVTNPWRGEKKLFFSRKKIPSLGVPILFCSSRAFQP